jgi:hypothetical protein
MQHIKDMMRCKGGIKDLIFEYICRFKNSDGI